MIKFFFKGKNPPSYLYPLVLLLFSFGYISSQEITIDGTVTFEGVPLPGVAILNKNTSQGGITDFDGNYSINASEGNKINFSFTGFKTVTHIVEKGITTVNIIMEEDTQNLDEVVVIAYGTSNKKELVGNVASVKAEEIEKVQAVTFEQALQGRAAGVRVVSSEGGPGSGLKVQVRNNTSFLANSEPLYVIDGFPILSDPEEQSTGVGVGGSFTSPLASIDPSTIESIEILKDATATGPYGARGANGVVLITTKSGKKGKPKLTLETTVGIQRVARFEDYLGVQDYINYYNDAVTYFPNSNGQYAANLYLFRDALGNPISADNPDVIVTDWRDKIFRDALMRKTSLSATGGSDKMRYAANFSYTNQEGIIINSDFKRYSANVRTNSNITDKLKFDLGINTGFIERNGVVTAAQFGSQTSQPQNIVNALGVAAPVQGRIQPNRLENLDTGEDFTVETDPETGLITRINDRDVVNPLRRLQEDSNITRTLTTNLNTGISYNFTKNLSLRSTFGGRSNATRGKSWANRQFGRGQQANGIANHRNSLSWSWSNDNILNYKIKLGKHQFISDLIYTQNSNYFETTRNDTRDFASDFANVDVIQNGTPNTTNSSRTVSHQKSGIFRLRYDYAKKYFLTSGVRSDRSSRFQFGSQVGYFWNVGGKWVASKEKFIKSLGVISNLEFKGSYGIIGNDRIPFGYANVSIENDVQQGVSFERLGNRELKWETTQQLDLGVNLSLFKNRRVNLQYDYFDKTTTDLLYFLPTSADLGLVVEIGNNDLFGYYANLGEISSKGHEISLGVDLLNSKKFKWNVNANITFSKAKIISLGPNDDLILDTPYERRVVGDAIIRPGEELGTYYGYQTEGVYQYSDFTEFDGLSAEESAALYLKGGTSNVTSDQIDTVRDAATITNGDTDDSSFTLKPGIARHEGEKTHRPGMRKYKDINGDGIINADDRTVIGKTQPDHFGGISNNFTVGNFDFSFLLNWSYGNDIYNKNRFLTTRTQRGRGNFNLLNVVADRWTPYNTDTDVPSLSGLSDIQGSGNITAEDSYIEDGSFLRLSNISLSYRIDPKFLESISLSELRFFAAVDNVYVWTKYSGYDPEVSVGNQQLYPGIDFGSYPRARTFRLGVRASF